MAIFCRIVNSTFFLSFLGVTRCAAHVFAGHPAKMPGKSSNSKTYWCSKRWLDGIQRRPKELTLWLFNSSPWKPWPIEIDGLPINSMVIFHGKVLVITRWLPSNPAPSLRSGSHGSPGSHHVPACQWHRSGQRESLRHAGATWAERLS